MGASQCACPAQDKTISIISERPTSLLLDGTCYHHAHGKATCSAEKSCEGCNILIPDRSSDFNSVVTPQYSDTVMQERVSTQVEGTDTFVAVHNPAHIAQSAQPALPRGEQRNGPGREVWPDGAYYEGEFSMGDKNGHGTFFWVDGSRYEGEFLRNHMHGQGVYHWQDGRKYEGQWLLNQMHGMGRFSFPDGRVYEGAYLNDLRHGVGTLKWQDGRQFHGQWAHGKEEGFGEFTTGKGMKMEGEWSNGVRLRWISTKDTHSSRKDSS
jgi:hypothetical protein